MRQIKISTAFFIVFIAVAVASFAVFTFAHAATLVGTGGSEYDTITTTGGVEYNQSNVGNTFTIGSARYMEVYLNYDLSSNQTDSPIIAGFASASLYDGCSFGLTNSADKLGGNHHGLFLLTSLTWNGSAYVDTGTSCDLYGKSGTQNIYVARHLGAVDYTTFQVGGYASQQGSWDQANVSSGTGTLNIFNTAFEFCEASGCTAPITDTSTHVISTTPANAATVSTTTTVGSEVYVNSSDWVSGMVLHVSMYNQTVAAVSANVIDACNVFGLAKCSMDFPITSAGDTVFSTTTTFNYAGTVNATWSIQVPTFWSSLPIIGGIFEPSVLFSTSTTFIVGQSTGLDAAITQGGQAVTNYLLTGTTTTDVVNCNALGFSLTSCLVSLVVPDSAAIGTFLNGFQGSFLQKVPFGYVTRFMAILTSTATSSLPSLVVTMPPGLPVAGESVDLTPWNDLFTGSSVLNTATSSSDGKTLRQAVEPDWDFFVLFCFSIAVIFELLGVAGRTNTGAGKHGGKRTEYISTEWVNRNTRH